jgi:hypothetical protein
VLPNPEPGLVIGYAYLWARRHADGHEEAEQLRPCGGDHADGMIGRGRPRV